LSANVLAAAGKSSRRLDQWLWFARFVKSRSLAARLCADGAVWVNGIAVSRANHAVRPGDVVEVRRHGWQRTVRVVALGARRGPPVEARMLFQEASTPRRTGLAEWEPLLVVDDEQR
jgi:ribosome-associated heat shock protein Hsp15